MEWSESGRIIKLNNFVAASCFEYSNFHTYTQHTTLSPSRYIGYYTPAYRRKFCVAPEIIKKNLSV